MIKKRKIKVLIIDDSLTIRETLSLIISSEPDFEVVGKAGDPYEAVKIMNQIKPDVITLDIEMPKMDGLTFLKKLMSQHPIPVIIISSLTAKSANITLRALELGAVEIISKPFNKTIKSSNPKQFIINQIRRASMASVKSKAAKHLIANKHIEKEKPIKQVPANRLICIGASTGGTEVISRIIQNINNNKPAIVIVQHMPPLFTKSFADRLNDYTNLSVKEAEDGDILMNNHIYVAPGGKHLEIVKAGLRLKIHTFDGDLVNHVKPSIDVTMASIASLHHQKSVGILLTGMGKDGAEGLKMIRETGGKTIAQDEQSSLVFGMPKQAIQINAAQLILNIEEIINQINSIYNA